MFQEPANADGDEERPDKHDHGDRVSLCFGNTAQHQARSISETCSLERFLVKTPKGHNCRAGAPPADLEWQPRRSPYNYFVGAMIRHAQPARKQRPPSGVTRPSQCGGCRISAMTYR